MTEVSSASWVTERLQLWDSTGVRVESFVPSGFEAYVRVVHPARERGGIEPGLRWADLGAGKGVPLSADAAFAEVTGIQPEDQDALDVFAPLEGTLPVRPCRALTSTLARFTRSPAVCWFCLWDGNGAFWSRSHTGPYEWDDSSAGARAYWTDAQAQDDFLHGLPKVETYARSYFLLRGPLDVACRFEIAGLYTSPNLCWPADRAWILITEVDDYSTYVGGSRAAIDAVLASEHLEAVEVALDTRMDVGPYRPRWR
jgi:hypothetical protein